MPVPSAITDLSTTPASNSPAGSETPASIDDYLRSHASFIAQLRAVIGGATNPNIPTATGTAAAANLTTSSLDTTAGRVLKVGDFGLGTPIVTTNLNTLTGTGLFACGDVTGTPRASILGWWVYQIDTGTGLWKNQTAWAQGAPTAQYVRSSVDGTTWGAWSLAVFANSPAFTGTPTAPTATVGTNTTQIATTAYVRGEFAASFAASFADNGYQKLPSGLIIQWGKNNAAADTTTTVTLPLSFPNAGFSVTTAFAVAGDYNDSCGAYFSGATSLILRNGSNTTRLVNWIAIGY